MSDVATVCIVDDDEAIRESLRLLLYAEDTLAAGYPKFEVLIKIAKFILCPAIGFVFQKFQYCKC